MLNALVVFLIINEETMAQKVINKINNKLKFLYRQATFLSPTCNCNALLCNALIQLHFEYGTCYLVECLKGFRLLKISVYNIA